MPPSKNNRASRIAALSVTGLALGAVLGYSLSSASSVTSPAAAPPSTGRMPAKPLAAEFKKQPAPTPWPTGPLFKGGLLPLAEFEAWLAGASCDEVTRELLDPAINGYPGSPAACSLIVSRYREFTVDQRFTCLQHHLTGDVRIMQYGLLPILSDLAKAALPRRADEILALFKKGNQLPSGLGAALADWATADFPAALAFTGKLEGYEKDEISGSLIAGLADRDMVLAQQEALKLPPGRARDSAISGLVWRMGKEDLAGTINWLMENNLTAAGRYGNSPLSSALIAAGVANPANPAQLIADLPGRFEGDEGPVAVRDYFQNWANKDPVAAAAWLREHPLSERHQRAAEEAVSIARWFKLPLDDALNEFRTLADPARDEASSSLVSRLIIEDPARAFGRLAAILPDKNSARGALDNLLVQLPNEYLPQALAQFPDLAGLLDKNSHLLDRLSYLQEADLNALLPRLPEKTQDAIRGKIMENSVTSDPERALALAADMDKSKLSPFTSSSLAVRLLQSDPAKAAEWVNDFAEGENKEWAALNLASNWTKSDPAAAVAWLETLPPGRTRDRATAEAAGIQGLSGNAQAALASPPASRMGKPAPRPPGAPCGPSGVPTPPPPPPPFSPADLRRTSRPGSSKSSGTGVMGSEAPGKPVPDLWWVRDGQLAGMSGHSWRPPIMMRRRTAFRTLMTIFRCFGMPESSPWCAC